jgi:thiamine-phosphate pyrophosphorylase
MIVITNPIAIENEINTIHALFECGLSCFMCENLIWRRNEPVLSKIGKEYWSRLVLHQQHH